MTDGPLRPSLRAGIAPTRGSGWSLGRSFSRGPRRSRGLLVTHLREREPCADGNHIQDGVRGVGRQAQTVKSFPASNPNVRRIRLRALFSQLSTLVFRTLVFFLREPLGGGLDGVMCGGECHMCERCTTLRTGYTSA